MVLGVGHQGREDSGEAGNAPYGCLLSSPPHGESPLSVHLTLRSAGRWEKNTFFLYGGMRSCGPTREAIFAGLDCPVLVQLVISLQMFYPRQSTKERGSLRERVPGQGELPRQCVCPSFLPRHPQHSLWGSACRNCGHGPNNAVPKFISSAFTGDPCEAAVGS